MSAESPLFSVIIPSYHHAAYLREAVEGVLAQPAALREVIAVDDASTDDSREILAEYARAGALRLIQKTENRGVSDSFQLGLEAARAPWVAICCSDDRWLPGHLAALAESVANAGEALVLYTQVGMIDAQGHPLPTGANFFGDRREEGDVFEALIPGNFVPLQAAVFRREAALAAGGFDRGIAILQDYDLWSRLALAGPFRCVDSRRVEVRWHGANLSYPDPAKIQQLQRDRIRTLDKLLADERARARGPRVLGRLRAVRASAWAKLARRTGDRAAAWAAIRDCPARLEYWWTLLRTLARGRPL